jgi:peptidoglycan/xylan/chitin deacetylase (PgdA/CDA1 family)
MLARDSEFASLGEVMRDGGPTSRLLAVTFDDAFDLIRTGAIEVLDAHGIKATTFAITATLDNRELMWRNKLSAITALRPASTYVDAYNRLPGVPQIAGASELMGAAFRWDMARKDELADALWVACDMPPLTDFLDEHRPYFTRDGLRTWRAHGHEVGLHTRTHPDCSRLDADALRAEILEPARELAAELGVQSLAFSYPFGRRCAPALAPMLEEARLLHCALGIRGFAQQGTSPMQLERASIENDMSFSVYGKAFLGLPR